MRVIAGKYKRRRLTCPRGQAIRPVPDRLKESLFSILQARLKQARVLDLCAGTGAMGIEALSRGAAWVTFVESWPIAIQTLKRNLQTCGLEAGYAILPRDVLVALPCLAQERETFDLIFFDPPYASELYWPVMQMLGQGHLLNPGGLVLVMHHAKTPLPENWGKLRRIRQLKQGENILSFYLLD